MFTTTTFPRYVVGEIAPPRSPGPDTVGIGPEAATNAAVGPTPVGDGGVPHPASTMSRPVTIGAIRRTAWRLAPGPRSPGGVLVAGQPATGQGHDPTLELPLAVLAARVEALGPAQTEPAARLVDVPVQADGGLVALD